MKKLIVAFVTLSSISAFACTKSLCSGDRVNFGEFSGTAVEVFNNGNVKIDVDGYSGYSIRKVSEMGKGMKCHQGVCKNDRVNFGEFSGTAVEVYNNGNVKIVVDGYSGHTFRQTKLLGVGFRCSGNLCSGDRVNFGNYTGTAVEVFNNGNVKIAVDGYSGHTFRKVQLLGYELQCYN